MIRDLLKISRNVSLHNLSEVPLYIAKKIISDSYKINLVERKEMRKYRALLHKVEIPITAILIARRYSLSKLVRLLKSSKEKESLRDEEPQVNCRECGKRPVAGPDGLCNHCRFNDVITQIAEKK